MCKILVTATDNTHIDPVVDRRGCYKKGYPVVIKPDSYTRSRSEYPPTFVLISCPEVTEAAALAYNNSWEQTVDYNLISADPATATYQVEVFGDKTNVSGEAGITQADVETFLNNWNCTVDSFGTNSVTFTMALWQALQSKGFWDIDVSAYSFHLDNYDAGTGVADVTVSNLPTNAIANAKRRIEEKGCVVLSETTTSITFAAERNDIFTEFKSDVQQATRKTWCRKQHYFNSATVDAALAVQDTFDAQTNEQLTFRGMLTLTQAELLAAINNKLDE